MKVGNERASILFGQTLSRRIPHLLKEMAKVIDFGEHFLQ